MKKVLENKNDKDKILENGNRLAEAEPRLKNISIYLDYMKEERETIRIKVAEGKDKARMIYVTPSKSEAHPGIYDWKINREEVRKEEEAMQREKHTKKIHI